MSKTEHSVETLAYAAGLIDAEGCVHVSYVQPSKANRRITPSYSLHVKVSNTDLPILEWLKATFGGVIVKHHARNDIRVGNAWSAAWHWQISGISAQSCLKLILPYLKIKKQQAIIAIEFQDFNQGHSARDFANRVQEVVNRRESYRQQINSLTRTKQIWTTPIADVTVNTAYTAGLFDGEGSVMILAEPNVKHRLRIKIANTDHAIINWIQSNFGGSISDNLAETRKRKPNENDAWDWRLNGKEARDFLLLIQPFLKIKHEQARLAIEFQEFIQVLPYGYKRIEGVFERCENYRTQVANLKKHTSTLLSAD